MGASFSPPWIHEMWAESESFNFEVWTDDDKTLALTLGAADSPSAIAPERMTFVLDEAGVVFLQYTEDVVAGIHPALVLEDLTILLGD